MGKWFRFTEGPHRPRGKLWIACWESWDGAWNRRLSMTTHYLGVRVIGQRRAHKPRLNDPLQICGNAGGSWDRMRNRPAHRAGAVYGSFEPKRSLLNRVRFFEIRRA